MSAPHAFNPCSDHKKNFNASHILSIPSPRPKSIVPSPRSQVQSKSELEAEESIKKKQFCTAHKTKICDYICL